MTIDSSLSVKTRHRTIKSSTLNLLVIRCFSFLLVTEGDIAEGKLQVHQSETLRLEMGKEKQRRDMTREDCETQVKSCQCGHKTAPRTEAVTLPSPALTPPAQFLWKIPQGTLFGEILNRPIRSKV